MQGSTHSTLQEHSAFVVLLCTAYQYPAAYS